MWEEVIAGAGGLLTFIGAITGLYVALRGEVRRSQELLQKDFDHLRSSFETLRTDVGSGFAGVRADIRRLDQKVDTVRGELINFLGNR